MFTFFSLVYPPRVFQDVFYVCGHQMMAELCHRLCRVVADNDHSQTFLSHTVFEPHLMKDFP